MYNPNYDKLPPQQGWQCPLCKMIWAPSVVSCACNKNEVKKKDVSNTIPLGDSWTITTSLPTEIDYPDIELINTIATVDTKTTPKDKPDCHSCLAGVGIMLASNPPQDGGIYCSTLGKKNPTKDECPGVIKYV